ncbi:hypothetical protein H2202_003750 [Exophiala xenobiotica]|nr:hypothetical protein H2202_003750 [Exophiala xenobiotica]KAK5213440.1 hypothetical protein LTR41_001019 [Exophiala xenobiotica]KAK5231116.1 hypothetical protein LTR72_000296 [Exophiala xenobiotica]KAK5299630.1 hypothetical protein LTR14_001844 [Exophiala xenobiotica]KAK5320198.1 hypothetical protein LTR93_007255 [Exophiala xenobiotica]
MPPTTPQAYDFHPNDSLDLPEWLPSYTRQDNFQFPNGDQVFSPLACQLESGNGVFDHDGRFMETSPASNYLANVNQPIECHNASIPTNVSADRVREAAAISWSPDLSPQVDTTNIPLQSATDNHTSLHSLFIPPIQEDATLPILNYEQEATFAPDHTGFDNHAALFSGTTSANTCFQGAVTPQFHVRSPFMPAPYGSDSQGPSSLPGYDFQPSFLGPDFTCQPAVECVAPQQVYPISTVGDHVDMSEYPPLPELSNLSYQPFQGSEDYYRELQDVHYPEWYLEEQALPQPQEETATFQGTNVHTGVLSTASLAHSPASSRQFESRNGQRDTSKDDFLVRSKARGLSYKQIKELGKFEEAESTLRGRYRALTKPKEARLRKPEWGDREIELLFEGVSQCSKTDLPAFPSDHELDAIALGQLVNKIPWKQVAEYMEGKGTYRYGNATVKKKYLEILKLRGAAVQRTPRKA